LEFFECIPAELREKVLTIYMGVELPDHVVEVNFRRTNRRTILIPARLAEKKGHEYLFRALAIVRDHYDVPIRCLVVGDGPLRKHLEQLRAVLNLEETVELVGQVPHEELFQLYAGGTVDAVVLPSVVAHDGEREGIPVALMEAMAFGIPIITTPNGGIRELAEGVGSLVPERDPQALAAAIHRLMSDELFAQEIGAAGRRRIEERFSTDAVVRQLERLWCASLRACPIWLGSVE
jgi:glycosyltransferase involved in cell wall biosynthesis